jgi:flagellar hook-associated protein 3 FlgL
MRVSTSMMFQQLTDKLSENAEGMKLLQGQLSTGYKYSAPSEAPDLVGRVQAVESRLKTLDTDAKSVSRVKVGVDAQARALEVAAEITDRLKELAFQGANSATSQSVLDGYAEEVASMRRSLIDLANAKDSDDRFVFGGVRSGEPPYRQNVDGTVEYLGSGTPLRVRVSDVGYEDVSVPGPNVWKGIPRNGESIDLFTALTELEQAYRSGDLPKRAEGLADVNAIADNIGLAIARTGGVQQRLEISERQAQETSIRAQQALSELKDLDFASALAQLQKQQLLMEATQSMLGRLSQLSLLDNLR